MKKLITLLVALSIWLGSMAWKTTVYAQSGGHNIVVTWGASPDFATGWSYSVYRGPAAGQESTTPIATGLTALTYTDTNVKAGDFWVYGIQTVSQAGGKSSLTETAGCTVPIAGVPTASCKAN